MKNNLLNTDFLSVVGSLPLSSFATATDVETVSRWYVTQDPKSGTPPTITVAKNPFVYPLAGSVPQDEAVNFLSIAVADLGTTLGTGAYWRLEGRAPMRSLRNDRATFSFWAKATVANTQVVVILRRNFGLGGSADMILKAQAFNLGTTWRRYGFNLAVADIPAGTVVAPGSFLGFGIYLFGDPTSLAPLAVGLPGTVGTVSVGLPQWEIGSLSTYEGNDAVRATGAGAVRAAQTLTFTGNAANSETVVINGQTYTFKTALSTGPTVANEVLVGANTAASIVNLQSAINALPSQAGLTFGAPTVANAAVYASAVTGTTLIVSASIPGTAGNAVTTTETVANASWGSTTLAGGVAATVDY